MERRLKFGILEYWNVGQEILKEILVIILLFHHSIIPVLSYSEARYPHSFLGHRLTTPIFPSFSTKNGKSH
jgi:hypothetical protein